MSRLKSALEREYESNTDNPVKVYNPKNLETVTFHFRGEKMAKVSSCLNMQKAKNNVMLGEVQQ